MNVPPQRKAKSLSIVLLFVLLWTLGVLWVNRADAAAPPEPVGSQVMGSLSGQAIACGNAFEQGVSSGYRCFMEQMVNGFVLDKATSFTNAYGKRLFGEHFSLANRLTYSQIGGGFSGEVDAVVPLSALAGLVGFGGQEDGPETGALFFQQGVTRWTDSYGLSRFDMRYGVVRRFNVSETPGAACQPSFNRTWNTVIAGSSPAWTMVGRGGAAISTTFCPPRAGATR